MARDLRLLTSNCFLTFFAFEVSISITTTVIEGTIIIADTHMAKIISENSDSLLNSSGQLWENVGRLLSRHIASLVENTSIGISVLSMSVEEIIIS